MECSVSLRRREKRGVIFIGRGLAGYAHAAQFEAFCERGLHEGLAVIQGNSSGGGTSTQLSEAQSVEELPARARLVTAGWRKIESEGPDAVFGLSDLRKKFEGLHLAELKDMIESPRSAILHPRATYARLKEALHAFKEIKALLYSDGLLETERLRRIVADYRPELGLTSPIHFETTVSNRDNDKVELLSVKNFRSNPAHFIDAIVASMSLRPFFPGVKLAVEDEKGKKHEGVYVDARCMEEKSPALAECSEIFVFLTHPEGYLPPRKTEELKERYGIPPILGDFIHEGSIRAMQLDAQKLSTLQVLCRERGARAIPIYTPVPRSVSALWFEKGDITRGLEIAEIAARKQFEEYGF
ncbi:MAG: hypothetical protein Q7S36_03075 [Candidatus Liptonbacteria bacterium]|nr:hypothetical protein [Candidatus Liptonbacteria bacterium]